MKIATWTYLYIFFFFAQNFSQFSNLHNNYRVTYLQLSGHKVFQEKGANNLSIEATILTEKFYKEEENGIESFP